jgi:hypothetical protein
LVDWNHIATDGGDVEEINPWSHGEVERVSSRRALKEFSKRQLEYIEKYETNRNFRMKEKVRALVRLIGLWLVIIPALFFLVRIVEFVRRMFKT